MLVYLEITQPFVIRICMFCAFTRLRYQVSVYRYIGPLVIYIHLVNLAHVSLINNK